ncbi:MAG TPA: Fe2+-dependent dioxygenase [Cellvibrionaceae bacterium]
MLLHIPQVIDAQTLADCRAALVSAAWVDGKASAGSQGAKVKTNRQLAVDDPVARQLGERILHALYSHPMYVAAALPLRIVPPMFNCYSGGGQYGNHVDGAVRLVPGMNLSLRTDVSSTLFLTEPDEYEGGELEITDTYGIHSVKLPAGDLVIYPSSSVHQVLPVTRGERICSFFWAQSMVRSDAQRSLLYQMDCDIQSLRRKHGDSPELVSLTGAYHNLLRQWAEV